MNQKGYLVIVLTINQITEKREFYAFFGKQGKKCRKKFPRPVQTGPQRRVSPPAFPENPFQRLHHESHPQKVLLIIYVDVQSHILDSY